MNLDTMKMIAVRSTKTVYRDGGRCIKVFVKDYPKANVFNEAYNHARIEETGLFIPKVLEVTSFDGRWGIVTEYIEGTTLESLMAANPDKKEEYLNLLVSLQLDVMSRSCPLLGRLRDKMTRMIISSELDATTRYDLHARLEELPRHSKICHGDFNPSNIVITPDGRPCILDWAHVTQGNASADAARTYFLLHLSGDEEGAKRYLSLFCEKSGTERAYVRRWLPLVAAAQSVAKGRSEDQTRLLAWANSEQFD